MTRVIALGSLDEARDIAQQWGRLHAEGASDIFTSPAWCLAGWRAFPDLGTPLLLIATDGAGALLGALTLTSGPIGPTWAVSPLGDEHDVRVRRGRPTLRSARRRLERSGQLTVVRVTDPVSLAAALPAFARTRLERWASRGRLAELPAMDRHPRFPEFLADAGSGIAVDGRCLFARLDHDGESLAQGLFFRSPGADLLYMSSYQPKAGRFGPSHLLLAEAARMAVAEGVRVVELGRGDEPYKFALGAQPRYLRDVILAPRTSPVGGPPVP